MKPLAFSLSADPNARNALHLEGAVLVRCLSENDTKKIREDTEAVLEAMNDGDDANVEEELLFSSDNFGSTHGLTVLRYALQERMKEATWLFNDFRGFEETGVLRPPDQHPVYEGERHNGNLMVLVILKGNGVFSLSGGAPALRKDFLASPGDAILVRLPGFMGSVDPPGTIRVTTAEKVLLLVYR